MSALLDALLGFGSGVLNVLDMPGSYTRGLLAGRPGDRLSGRDMLEEWGFLNENQEGLDAGDVGGFAADVLVDPLNALGGLGIARKLGQIEKANDASRAMRAAGAMPEEIAALTKAVDESGNPVRMFHGSHKAFDEYDPQNLSDFSLYGKGIYTTDNPHVAAGYAGLQESRKGGSNIRQQYLDVRNPLMIDETYDISQLAMSPENQKRLLEKTEELAKLREAESFDQAYGTAFWDLKEKVKDVNKRRGERLIEQYRVSPELEELFFEKLGPSTTSYRNTLAHLFDPENAELIGGGYYNDALAGLSRFMGDDPAEQLFRELGSGKGFVADVGDIEKLRPSQLDKLHRAASNIASRHKQTFEPTSEMTGKDIWEALKRQPSIADDQSVAQPWLKDAGFDAIFHEGGHLAGKGDLLHNVKIALDPSQVYLPYIAPAFESRKKVAPLLAALLAYNAGARLN